MVVHFATYLAARPKTAKDEKKGILLGKHTHISILCALIKSVKAPATAIPTNRRTFLRVPCNRMYRLGADGSIRVGVFDDGVGFDAAGFTPAGLAAYNGPIKTMGIRGMEERAAMLKGKLDITSEPGVGTSLRLVIPPERGQKERANDESDAD